MSFWSSKDPQLNINDDDSGKLPERVESQIAHFQVGIAPQSTHVSSHSDSLLVK